MAILNNAVAFTYCDARKEAFEMYGTESWMAMAVVDFVASKLEGLAEGNNAASMVKAVRKISLQRSLLAFCCKVNILSISDK